MKPNDQEIYPELKKIENEIKEIKILILKSNVSKKKPVKLEGALKGSRITDDDIAEAEKSLLRTLTTFVSDFSLH